MKKFLSVFLCAVMVLTLVACGSSKTGGDTMALTDMVDKLYEGISADEMPAVMTQEVTSDVFEGVFFIPAIEGAEAVVSEPMMSSVAYSVCLLRVPEGSDVESVRAEIEANVNPAKWVCVDAENVDVIANGSTILLVMTDEANIELHEAIVNNFNALWK